MNAESEAVNRIVSTLRPRTFDSTPNAYCHSFLMSNGKRSYLTSDGVGTKTIIAKLANKWDTIGLDLIAMNANDLICRRAVPWAFSNYIAVEQANPDREEQIAKGILDGAVMAGMQLCGGEYSVMPDVIKGVDISGTAVGLDFQGNTPRNIYSCDAIIGLESSGIHSNGITLARNILRNKLDDYLETLLTPTKIYMDVLNWLDSATGLAHITGGGFKNLKRVCPHGMVMNNLPDMDIFQVIQETGNLSPEEMYSNFNMGIGFCIFTRIDFLEPILRNLDGARLIGRVIRGNNEVTIMKNDKIVCVI